MALSIAGISPELDVRIDEFTMNGTIPGLKIDVTRVGEADIPVTVSVTPRSEDVDLMPEVVELWVNDFRLGKWPSSGKRAFSRDEVLTYTQVIAGAGNETTGRLIGWLGKVLGDRAPRSA